LVVKDTVPKDFITLQPGQKHCSKCWTQQGSLTIQPLAGCLPKTWSHMALWEFSATGRDHAHNSWACLCLHPHKTEVSQRAIRVVVVCTALQPHGQATVTTDVSMASGAPSLCMHTVSSPYRASWVGTVVKNCLPLYQLQLDQLILPMTPQEVQWLFVC